MNRLATILEFTRAIVHEDDPPTLARRACTALTVLLPCSGAWWLAPRDTGGGDAAVTTGDRRLTTDGITGLGDRPDEHELAEALDEALDEALAGRETGPTVETPLATDGDDDGAGARVAWTRALRTPAADHGALLAFLTVAPDARPLIRSLFDELADLLAAALDSAASDGTGRAGTLAPDIADAARDAVVLIDPGGRVQFWNAAASQLFGYEEAEARGQDLHELIAPASYHQRYREAFASFRETGDGAAIGETLELIGRHRDGSMLSIELSLSALQRPDGWYAIGVMRDITERKRTEAALRRAEAKWRNILVETPQLGVSLDGDARIVFANAKLLELTGWTADEVLGASWFDLFIPAEVREEVRAVFARAADSHDSLDFSSYENEILTRDGDRRTVSWANVVTRDLAGEVVDITCLGIDISERRHMEVALRQREHYLQTVLQTTIDAHWAVDVQGTILEVNDAFCDLLGYHRDELEGRTIADIDVDESPAVVAERMQRIVAHGGERFEVRVASQGGEIIPLEVSASYVAEGDGAVICFGRDLTRRKEAEERLWLQTSLQKLLVEISSESINLAPEDMDAAIDASLGKLARFVGADRAYLFRDDPGGATTSNTHEWCGEGIAPGIENLQDLPLSRARPLVTAHERGEAFHAHDVRDLEPGFLRDLLTSQDIKSLVTLPILRQGACTGFVGFDFVRSHHALSEVERDLLAVFANILANLHDRRRAQQQIAMLATIVDLAPSSVSVHDESGRFRYANRETLELHGYTAEEFLAVNLHDLDTPASEVLLDERIRRIREHGEATFETSHYRRDGEEFPLEVMARAIDWYGEPAILSIATDITERKRAERLLHASEERHRRLFETMAQGVVYQDADGSVITANPAARRITGLELEAGCDFFSQRGCPEAVCDDGTPLPTDTLPPRVALRTGEPVIARTLGIRHAISGERVWLAVTSIPLRDQDGAVPSRVYTTFSDVTVQFEAAAILRQFKTVFDTANFGMAIASLDGELSYVNARFAADHGYTPDELVGQPIGWLHSDAQPSTVDELLAQIRRDGAVGPLEVGRCRRDGTEFPMLMSGILIRDARGEPESLAASAIDLSERKQLEEQLLQAQKMESVGRLAGGVAHDFNNMLNVILGYADLMAGDLPPDSSLREGLDRIQAAARRSADLTRQLLAFARKQTIAPRVLDLDATVTSMLGMLERLIGENVALVWRPGSGTDRVRIDPAQIDQVLANLVVNARDAIDLKTGTITIATGRTEFDEGWCEVHEGYEPGRYVRLTVSDDGCGMDAVTLASVFEPFFTTKDFGEGTGLGLATVYGIVKQNEGFVQVHSEPGQGTTFDIYLPAQGSSHEADPKSATDAGAPVAGGRETIMVVEDEEDILGLARAMLERLGYHVLATVSPAEASRLADAHAGQIDLLLTDVVMPEMSGCDLVDRLSSSRPGLRHLYMSGHPADLFARTRSLDHGQPFLAKPFTLEELGARVRAVLDGAAPDTAQT